MILSKRNRELTEKQRFFVVEYLIDFNGAQAAIRAGYSTNGAKVTASKLLTNANVQTELAKELQERCDRVKVDSTMVLQRLVDIDSMDVADVLNDDCTIKPISEWPKIWRQFVSGVELAELFEGRGDARTMVGLLKKIKWPDKLRNLELLGKHVNIQAFTQRMELTGKDGGPIQLERSDIDLNKLSIDELETFKMLMEKASVVENS